MRIMIIIPASKQSMNRGASAPAFFSFDRAKETQIELLLKEINVRKLPGHDMIPPKLTEESAAPIARPIKSIIITLAKFSNLIGYQMP